MESELGISRLMEQGVEKILFYRKINADQTTLQQFSKNYTSKNNSLSNTKFPKLFCKDNNRALWRKITILLHKIFRPKYCENN